FTHDTVDTVEFNPRYHSGCDIRVQTDLPSTENFNPRTHMGCDRTAMYGLDTLRMISIHAPTWGATANALLTKHGYVISIHAPTWGATVPTAAYAFVRGQFQSTHPHGVRPPFFPESPSASEFQSTHPHGVRRHG